MFRSPKVLCFFIIFVFTSIACLNRAKSISVSEARNSNAIQISPTPFSVNEVKFKGKNAPVKIKSNFELSVKSQELPHLWLEFDYENGNTTKKTLPSEIKEVISPNWNHSLLFLYNKYGVKNSEDLVLNASKLALETIRIIDELGNIKINLNGENRYLNQNEIEQLLTVQSILVRERFIELQKYFDKQPYSIKFKQK